MEKGNEMNTFLSSASSRETSVEIMEAIDYVAGHNEIEAVRVWQEPSEAEMIAIWERVTKNGLIDAAEFCWGAAGSDWAPKS